MQALRSVLAWRELRRIHKRMERDINNKNLSWVDWRDRTRRYEQDIATIKRWVKEGW